MFLISTLWAKFIVITSVKYLLKVVVPNLIAIAAHLTWIYFSRGTLAPPSLWREKAGPRGTQVGNHWLKRKVREKFLLQHSLVWNFRPQVKTVLKYNLNLKVVSNVPITLYKAEKCGTIFQNNTLDKNHSRFLFIGFATKIIC